MSTTKLRHLSVLDTVLGHCQTVLTSLNQQAHAARSNPAAAILTDELNADEQRISAGLMRVNHSGEICAQALYQGQAITARSENTKIAMQQSALEEVDHLAWCQQRLQELGSRPSYLDPAWYAGSFLLGLVAGIAGDAWSLGFVAETEKQVEQHLNSHKQRLPLNDHKSLAIIEQMRADEAHHAAMAREHGARELPKAIQQLMRMVAKVMTTTAYHI